MSANAILWSPMTTWGRLSLGVILIALMTNSATGAEPKRVLIVHSGTRATPPFAAESIAFRTTLTKELGERVDMKVALDVPIRTARFLIALIAPA